MPSPLPHPSQVSTQSVHDTVVEIADILNTSLNAAALTDQPTLVLASGPATTFELGRALHVRTSQDINVTWPTNAASYLALLVPVVVENQHATDSITVTFDSEWALPTQVLQAGELLSATVLILTANTVRVVGALEVATSVVIVTPTGPALPETFNDNTRIWSVAQGTLAAGNYELQIDLSGTTSGYRLELRVGDAPATIVVTGSTATTVAFTITAAQELVEIDIAEINVFDLTIDDIRIVTV